MFNILDASAIISSRRGIELCRFEVRSTTRISGWTVIAAFFFDGLQRDEVGYIDKRIAILSSKWMSSCEGPPPGAICRFVLASRPAAIQPVDIPEACEGHLASCI